MKYGTLCVNKVLIGPVLTTNRLAVKVFCKSDDVKNVILYQ